MLKVRSVVKSRKPTFKRRQTNQFAKLANDLKWRRPKGMGNKVRRNRRGQPSMPSVGYRSPKAVRGLNRDGLKEVLVYNLVDLKKVDSKTQIAVIGKAVGGKKKLEILNEAKKSNVLISNVKSIDDAIKSLTKEKKEKKEKKVVKETKKVSAKKEEKTAKSQKPEDKKEAVDKKSKEAEK